MPIIMDNFLPDGLARACEVDWPDKNWRQWHFYGPWKKLASRSASDFPKSLEAASVELAKADVKQEFQLDCFPDLGLYGAGLHEMRQGSELGRHLDSDHHPLHEWRREISGVLFLNSVWRADWGGDLVFSTSQGNETGRVSPKFNRLVLFQCTDESFHAVEQVTCPIDTSRKTLAMFWWSTRESERKRPISQFMERSS